MVIFSTTVSDSFLPYPKPQASGNRMDVRYFAVEDPANPVGILIVAEDLVSASALHYAARDYDGKNAVYELGVKDYTILSVDYNKSRSTGGATCGPDTLSQYRLFNDGTDYAYTYTIVPYLTPADDIAELSKQWRDVNPFDIEEYNREKAAEIEAMIDSIGVVLSYDQLQTIQAAREAYDKLRDEVKELVRNLDVLEAAEALIGQLEGAKAYIKDKSAYANHAEITGTSYPGRLVQSYTLDGITVTLTLICVSDRSAMVYGEIMNDTDLPVTFRVSRTDSLSAGTLTAKDDAITVAMDGEYFDIRFDRPADITINGRSYTADLGTITVLTSPLATVPWVSGPGTPGSMW